MKIHENRPGGFNWNPSRVFLEGFRPVCRADNGGG
jgi:hypothetical protein